TSPEISKACSDERTPIATTRLARKEESSTAFERKCQTSDCAWHAGADPVQDFPAPLRLGIAIDRLAQLGAKRRHVFVTVLGAFGQRAQDQAIDGCAERSESAGARRRHFEMQTFQLVAVWRLERQASREHAKQERAQRINVGARVHTLAPNL